METYFCAEKEEINRFIQGAKPMDKFIYYSGYLYTHLLGRALGAEIYEYASRGLVYLVQQRSASYIGFDYIMIKASRPPKRSLLPFNKEKVAELERKKGNHYVRSK